MCTTVCLVFPCLLITFVFICTISTGSKCISSLRKSVENGKTSSNGSVETCHIFQTAVSNVFNLFCFFYPPFSLPLSLPLCCDDETECLCADEIFSGQWAEPQSMPGRFYFISLQAHEVGPTALFPGTHPYYYDSINIRVSITNFCRTMRRRAKEAYSIAKPATFEHLFLVFHWRLNTEMI